MGLGRVILHVVSKRCVFDDAIGFPQTQLFQQIIVLVIAQIWISTENVGVVAIASPFVDEEDVAGAAMEGDAARRPSNTVFYDETFLGASFQRALNFKGRFAGELLISSHKASKSVGYPADI